MTISCNLLYTQIAFSVFDEMTLTKYFIPGNDGKLGLKIGESQ